MSSKQEHQRAQGQRSMIEGFKEGNKRTAGYRPQRDEIRYASTISRWSLEMQKLAARVVGDESMTVNPLRQPSPMRPSRTSEVVEDEGESLGYALCAGPHSGNDGNHSRGSGRGTTQRLQRIDSSGSNSRRLPLSANFHHPPGRSAQAGAFRVQSPHLREIDQAAPGWTAHRYTTSLLQLL